MNKYEAMIIVSPDLSEEDKKTATAQIGDAVVKYKGEVTSLAPWSEKRKFYFPIKKHAEGVYYLMNFQAPSAAIAELKVAYGLNEYILRVLISRL